MKPNQIAVNLYWKGVHGRDQRINAIASDMSLLDEGERKSVSLCFDGLSAIVKAAFETAQRRLSTAAVAEDIPMAIEIHVEEDYSMVSLHGYVINIPVCHFVDETGRYIVYFTFEKLRRNESFSTNKREVTRMVNEAYGSDIEEFQEETATTT